MSEDALTLRHTQILLVLAEGASHGYAIGKAVEASGGEVLLPGSLYRALSQLLRRGLIDESDATDPVDPRRREYRLTRAGRRALAAELERIGELVKQGRRLGIVQGRS